jgi:RNA polymerase sigma factor (TIGR02999 family)
VSEQLTLLLKRWKEGDFEARNQLFEQVFIILKQIASKKLKYKTGDVILQPTLLVNEAFIKLANQKQINFNDRKHFFAIAARVILQIILDHREKQSALMRGGNLQQVSFTSLEIGVKENKLDSILLEQALDDLNEIDERAAYIFQLKYILGFTIQEICQELSIGHATVEEDLKMAKAWLANRLS